MPKTARYKKYPVFTSQLQGKNPMKKLALALLSASFFFVACRGASFTPPLALTDPATGIHVEVSQQDSLPELKILLPGQPASDPGIVVLFPEHVTALERGKSGAVHLYVFRPGPQSARPTWRLNGQSLEYEMD